MKRPSLFSIQTVVATSKMFKSSIGGVTLDHLYPHQRYKVRVCAKNALGIGHFSSDVKVCYIIFEAQTLVFIVTFPNELTTYVLI